jgi:hypothetical protein
VRVRAAQPAGPSAPASAMTRPWSAAAAGLILESQPGIAAVAEAADGVLRVRNRIMDQ